jgi:hypothetical protein
MISLTVVPANVTVAPVCSDWRSRVLEAGMETPDNTMSVHELTAEEISAYAVIVCGT